MTAIMKIKNALSRWIFKFQETADGHKQAFIIFIIIIIIICQHKSQSEPILLAPSSHAFNGIRYHAGTWPALQVTMMYRLTKVLSRYHAQFNFTSTEGFFKIPMLQWEHAVNITKPL